MTLLLQLIFEVFGILYLSFGAVLLIYKITKYLVDKE